MLTARCAEAHIFSVTAFNSIIVTNGKSHGFICRVRVWEADIKVPKKCAVAKHFTAALRDRSIVIWIITSLEFCLYLINNSDMTEV